MAEISSIPLLALIQEQGLVDDLQLEEVVQEHTRSGKPVIQLLQDFGLLDMETILQIMASHLGTEVVELRELELTPEILQTVPATAARMHDHCVGRRRALRQDLFQPVQGTPGVFILRLGHPGR